MENIKLLFLHSWYLYEHIHLHRLPKVYVEGNIFHKLCIHDNVWLMQHVVIQRRGNYHMVAALYDHNLY